MNSELIITLDWLKEHGASDEYLNQFKSTLLKDKEGIEVSQALKNENLSMNIWLVDKLPFNSTPLEVDKIWDTLFYNGDVYVKGNVITNSLVYIKGDLITDEGIIINEVSEISAKHINAKNIVLSGESIITGEIKAKNIYLSEYAIIKGDIEAVKVNMCNLASIVGNVTTETIKMHDQTNVDGDIFATSVMIKDGSVTGNIKSKTLLRI